MRIAVISDMHGNDLAFEIVEADIQEAKYRSNRLSWRRNSRRTATCGCRSTPARDELSCCDGKCRCMVVKRRGNWLMKAFHLNDSKRWAIFDSGHYRNSAKMTALLFQISNQRSQ